MIEWWRMRIWRGSDVPLPPGQHDGPTAPVALEVYAPRGGYIEWFYVCVSQPGCRFCGIEGSPTSQALHALRIPSRATHFGMTPELLLMLNQSRHVSGATVDFLYAGWCDIGTSPRLIEQAGCVASAAAINWPKDPDGLKGLVALCQTHTMR
jgi:hypothetical protein